MTSYIEFEGSGGPVLFEVDSQELRTEPGVTKAGLRDVFKKNNVAEAKTSLDDALQASLVANASALDSAVGKLDRRPKEVELTFGLKATGEFGNVVVAKATAEATLQIRILWKDDTKVD